MERKRAARTIRVPGKIGPVRERAVKSGFLRSAAKTEGVLA
jgi:hypothetical protein